ASVSEVFAQLAGAALVLAILLTLLGWEIGWERSPGDLGDTRFNMYVLEHFFRWLQGKDMSLASPDMYYPFPGVLFFSDTHAGTAWVYAVFRFIGLNYYSAYKAWFFTGYILTFAAAYYVLLCLGTRAWIAMAGAAFFTFCLPSTAQFG